jgi:hypothetical protein
LQIATTLVMHRGFLNYPDGLDVDVFRDWSRAANAR